MPPGTKITWTNNADTTVDTFTLPTCVSPQDKNPAPLAPGDTAPTKYNVDNGKHGKYSYSYTVVHAGRHKRTLGTLNGTIDVS